jgi:hypothetical protein
LWGNLMAKMAAIRENRSTRWESVGDIPIILVCNAWGAEWDGKQVTCYCDNQVIIATIRSRSSRHKGIMHLTWCLVFVEAN